MCLEEGTLHTKTEFKNCSFTTQYVCVFLAVFKVSSHCFPTDHSPFCISNGNVLRSPCHLTSSRY